MENHIQRKRRCAFNVLFSLGRSPNFECVFKGGFYPVLSLLISDFFGHCGRCHFKMKHLEWVRFFYELILLLFCRLYFHIFLSSKPEGECWTISSGFFFKGSSRTATIVEALDSFSKWHCSNVFLSRSVRHNFEIWKLSQEFLFHLVVADSDHFYGGFLR